MKTKSRQGLRRFQLRVTSYGYGYYVERIAQLEAALAKKPRRLQIDMVGAAEIPADPALLIRSVLMGRSPKTRIITAARSSLQGGAVMVWLLGDSRIIRDDARLYFRRADLSENQEAKPDEVWKDEEPNPWIHLPKPTRRKAITPECWKSSMNSFLFGNWLAASLECRCCGNSASWKTKRWTISWPPAFGKSKSPRKAR